MANARSKSDDSTPRGKEWILPTKTIDEALALAHRFQQADGLRRYLLERSRLVYGAVGVIGVIGLACALAVMVFLADWHAALALPALILMPFVLIGSAFVLGLMFFRWLEVRALTLALGHRVKRARWSPVAMLEKRWRVSLGRFPPVPWLLGSIFVLLPFAMMLAAAPFAALLLLALAAATPVAYVFLDR